MKITNPVIKLYDCTAFSILTLHTAKWLVAVRFSVRIHMCAVICVDKNL